MMPPGTSQFAEERRRFHASLLASDTLTVNALGIASNADKSQKSSVAYARAIAESLEVTTVAERLAGQTSGGNFEEAVRAFLEATFPRLGMLRPGRWAIRNLGGSRRAESLARFEPYTHLFALANAVERDATLRAVLGNAYAISPDVVVTREPESDHFINAGGELVDDTVGRHASIRLVNNARDIVHAVISCKWTLRSDRAQNARSEALNLIRNRKGRLPHIVVVTGEPTPSRLSSLALGTGDIDCVYHFALPELQHAVLASDNDEAMNLLDSMVEGKRLKDIADLPLDLAV